MLKPIKGLGKAGLFFWMAVFILSAGAPTFGQEQKMDKPLGMIKGRILDYDNRKPLSNVTVSIKDSEWTALSDAAGSYEFMQIPVGYYVLGFELDGYYTDTHTDVPVKPGHATFVNVEMYAVRMVKEEIRVTADYFPQIPDKKGSQMQFNAEELRRDAGSAGDVSRALYDVPGIVKADEEANDLIVRGGSPAENGFYVDNIFVPNINHFPQWGASGGNINMLNMRFIDSLNIYTGGFDASYGNRLSSIVEIGYREGNREKFAGQINLGIIGGGGQIEGPFANKNGSFMLSAYRSYLDLIAPILDTGNPSDYYDFQGKVVYDINSSDRLSFLTINGHSETKEDPEFEQASGIGDYSWERFNISNVGLTWRHLWGGKGFSDTSISYSFMKAKDEGWTVSENRPAYFFSYHNDWITFRNVNQIQLGSAHQLKFGVEAQHINFKSHNFDEEGEKKLDGTFGSVFASYLVYPFENFSLSTGLRLDYFPLSERIHLSPRISFNYVLTDRFSINGAYGMFYQQMPLFLLKLHPDNIKLKDMQARHLILGFRYLLSPDTQLTLETYDKQYDFFPMSTLNPYFYIIDDISGDDAMFSNWGSLLDIGKSYARGVELTLQKKLAKNLYGLVSLTYFRAKYRDLMGNWRNRMYDNRFIVALSGGYRPNQHWEFNLRWIWMGGRAFSPVDEAKSRQYGFPWYDYKDIMSGHLSAYKSLSFRVERRFYFKKSNLNLYLGAWNVFDLDNELYRFWDSYGNQYLSDYMWGAIPFVGIEFEF